MQKTLLLSLAFALIPTVAYSADVERGKKLFSERCASCHGPDGKGDGPLAASLPADQKPRNLQLGDYKKITDDASLKGLLKNGGPSLGLSPLMPPQPDLADPDLDALVAFVRSLKK